MSIATVTKSGFIVISFLWGKKGYSRELYCMQHFFQIKFHLMTTNFIKGRKKDVARASSEAVWKFYYL